jgi:hypothetical protein
VKGGKKKEGGCISLYTKPSCFIIQKYIEQPLLVNRRKFDIRIWALVTHKLEVYVFKEPYLRLATCEYNTKELEDPFVHLTNNAVQKNAPNYGNLVEGNILSFP